MTRSLALLELITSSWVSQAIYVAARLGIADLLAQGAKTSEELASSIEAHADSLRRLLRALTALGICEELEGGVFELTSFGSQLRAGEPGSLRAFALHWGGSMWPTWGGLLHTVKTGKNPRALVTRSDSFESLARSPDALRVFDEAMTEISRLAAAGVVSGYDFSSIGRLADVGGGRGELLAAILKRHPAMRGVLFERSQICDDARQHLESAGVAARCEIVPGSFFDAIPAGADLYLLKSILHDWDDDRAAAILANCRRAMNGSAKILVVERVLPERMHVSAEHRLMAASDLGMMVALGGRERSEADFRALFRSAGFAMTGISDAAAHFSMIEGRCA